MTQDGSSNLDLALIGNCIHSALIDRTGRITWACLPSYDGDPMFCRLIDNDNGSGGFFDIRLDGFQRAEQDYIRNTAVLTTTLYAEDGSAVEITDFAPRFKQFGRTYRPVMIVRIIRPVSGSPRITVRLRPSADYGARRPESTYGSNHIRYLMTAATMRLTTNAPLAMVRDEIPFVLEGPITMIYGPDETLAASVVDTGRDFLERTVDYWLEWVRYLSIPYEWQDAVIRAAITLKLCNFEETGAVIAAMTTSIPEAPDSGRNWDYRYCWLRDAFFVVQALNRLGATRTMEAYLRYITNVVASSNDGFLQPVYGITTRAQLTERVIDTLSGFRAMGPVRVGNQAYEHVQNDVYGSVILASIHFFFDERLRHPGDAAMFERLEQVGAQCVARYDKPDAGIWEYREREEVHTHSAVMCWAGCDRLARIGRRLGRDDRAHYWEGEAARIRAEILEAAWNEELGSFVSTFGGSDLDASLLLLNEFGFVAADDPRFAGTVTAIEKHLKKEDYIYRYATKDDFGMPQTAFLVCTFWYINALAALGRRDEARALFERMLSVRNPCGLLSEDLDIQTGALWGNFPQTYSMVGLINSAMVLSRSWEEAL
ncbi:MAG: glycoside hydrolase family 15 protein [Alphaproteobacteria bacterium]|nr:glycoside hydrolase family 15 protein [Alphaproteobacteria bacterium]